MVTVLKRVSWKISAVFIVAALVAPLSSEAAWQGDLTVANDSGDAIDVTFIVDGVESKETIRNTQKATRTGADLKACIRVAISSTDSTKIEIGYVHVKKHTETTLISTSSPKLKYKTVKDRDKDDYKLEKDKNHSGDNNKIIQIKKSIGADGNVDKVSC